MKRLLHAPCSLKDEARMCRQAVHLPWMQFERNGVGFTTFGRLCKNVKYHVLVFYIFQTVHYNSICNIIQQTHLIVTGL